MVVRSTLDASELDEVYRLRATVWRAAGFSVATGDRWQDAHDVHAHHVIAVADHEIVAAARICLHGRLDELPDAHVYAGLSTNGPVAALNRLVAQPRVRGLGVSRRLDESRLQWAKAAGVETVVANVVASTGMSRVRSLEEQGFRRLCDGVDRGVGSHQRSR